MPSTNRFLDELRRTRALGRALPRLAVVLVLLGIPASCSDDPAVDPPATPPDGGSPPDAGDSGSPGDAGRDATPYDAGRLTVDCKVTPCAKDLSASWSESFCALLSDGRIACWGRNEASELGRTEKELWSAVPRPVDGVAQATALDRTCAVLEGGAVRCWGPPAGTATGGEPTAAIPVPPSKLVRIGQGLGCALTTEGAVSCWGTRGTDGVLAYAGIPDAGDAGDASVAVPPTIVPLGGQVDELAIAYGRRRSCSWCAEDGVHAVIARKTDGSVVSWGLSPLVGRPTSRLPDPEPAPIPVEQAHLFGGAGACVTSRGALLCWGYRPDDLGEPRAVPQISSAAQAALGDFKRSNPAERFGRGCVASPLGDVYCWGQNDFGQAGDGTTTLRSEPAKVQGLPEPIVRVEVTHDTSCALGVSGRVYCWGDDSYGQRGQKVPFTNKPTPLPVELP